VQKFRTQVISKRFLKYVTLVERRGGPYSSFEHGAVQVDSDVVSEVKLFGVGGGLMPGWHDGCGDCWDEVWAESGGEDLFYTRGAYLGEVEDFVERGPV
jgi:hypothetical protein